MCHIPDPLQQVVSDLDPDDLLECQLTYEPLFVTSDSDIAIGDSVTSLSVRSHISWADSSSEDETLELCDVKPFRKDDEAWRCSKSDSGLLVQMFGQPAACLSLDTQLPSSFSEMMACLLDHSVQLESIMRGDSGVHMFVLRQYLTSLSHLSRRSIRCLNLALEKRIFVRYTMDDWKTQGDVDAHYTAGGDHSLDRFVATVPLSTEGAVKMQFVLCYQVNGCEHWDNNGSRNYHAEIEESERTPQNSPRPSQKRRTSILKGQHRGF
jgi:protein phosphatase 1 regulatory subunit 3A/B/C/D/E